MTSTKWRLCAAGALACAAASLPLGACASDENGTLPQPDAAQVLGPEADASAEAETGPCTDCEFFPATCAPDVLCPSGPFDATDPAVGMDWRTRINVIAGRSASDAWFAGAVGAVAHFDGTAWTPSEVGTQESQRVLWLPHTGEISLGSLQRIFTRGLDAGTDAAVSAGGWSLLEPPRFPDDFGFELRAGWAAPGSDSLWMATDSTLWRLHLNAESTIEVAAGIPSGDCGLIPCNRILSIHGASASTLFAVGEFGAALRITGADGDAPTATQLNPLTWTGLTDVWAASDTDAWAVGGSGTIRHYTGAPLQWDVITNVPTTEGLNGVWGTTSSDVWAVGNAGVVLHYDGTTWTRVKIAGLGARRPDLYGVWSPAPGRVWIGGYGVLLALGGTP
jgi:hypothetical protein